MWIIVSFMQLLGCYDVNTNVSENVQPFKFRMINNKRDAIVSWFSMQNAYKKHDDNNKLLLKLYDLRKNQDLEEESKNECVVSNTVISQFSSKEALSNFGNSNTELERSLEGSMDSEIQDPVEVKKIKTESVKRLVVMGHLYYQQSLEEQYFENDSKKCCIQKFEDLKGNSCTIKTSFNVGLDEETKEETLTLFEEEETYKGNSNPFKDGTVVLFHPWETIDLKIYTYRLDGKSVTKECILHRPAYDKYVDLYKKKN